MIDRPFGPSPLHVGIVGAGMISDVHVRGLRRIPGVSVVGIADADRRRAQAKGQALGIPGVFSSARDLLREAAPQVVHVLTPPFTHGDTCVELLEAGAHVYVEKPMAMALADCDRMIAAADRTGRALCVGHCTVFDPLVQRALALVEGGELGEVVHATAVYCFDTKRIPGYRNKSWYRQLPGGFVEDLAAHPAALLLRVLGPASDIRAVRDARRDDSGVSGVTAVVSAARGTGTLVVSLDARPEDVSLEVRCTRGTVAVNLTTMAMTVQRERGLPKKVAHGLRSMESAAQIVGQTMGSTAQVLMGRRDTTKGIHSLIHAFYEALRGGRRPPVDGRAGREAVALLRTIWPESESPVGRPGRRVLRAAASGRDHVPRAEPPLRALVTGATGFIGTHLIRALADRGVQVRALARTEARGARLLRRDIEVVVGDFADPEVIDGLATDIDVIFHLASVMTGPGDDFERVDIDGSRRLIEEAKRAGARRIVFTSTMGAYALGDLRDGARVTEEMIDVPERVGHYSRAKLLIERMLMEAHDAGALEAVIVRPGLVFGPGLSPYLTHLPHLGSLRGDRYVVFGDGEVPLQLTYVENTVDALWLCATRADAAGQTFTIIDEELPTQREFVRRLAELTGRPLRVTAIPRPIAYALGLGVETAARLTKRKPPTTRRLLLGKTTKLAFDCSRAARVLGWRPAVSWEEGLRRAVVWANEEGTHNGAGRHVPAVMATR